MKRMLLAGAIALSAAVPALAADLPVAPPAQAPAAYVPVVAPVYNWTGVYIGINGGYAFGDTNWSPAGFTGTGNFDTNGGVAGGTAGINFQMGQFVLGFEGDFDWSGISGSTTNTTATISGICGPGFLACTYQTSNDWLGTFRGRVGYAFDRVMVFATGGGAVGDVKATFTNPNAGGVSGGTDTTEFGWTIGGGVEAALTDNLTAKVEYLYVNLQDGNCISTICQVVPAVPVSFEASLVRAGLNFKFNPF
jgi:outer membrane immunogenic protein